MLAILQYVHTLNASPPYTVRIYSHSFIGPAIFLGHGLLIHYSYFHLWTVHDQLLSYNINLVRSRNNGLVRPHKLNC